MDQTPLTVLQDIVSTSLRKGASAADIIMVDSTHTHMAVRSQKLEKMERSQSSDLGLRVFMGKQQALVSSSYSHLTDIDDLTDRALAMAKASPEDPYCGLAERADVMQGEQVYDNSDSIDVHEKTLQDWAIAAEAAAKDIAGVSNTEGADSDSSQSKVYLVNSNGFAGRYSQSSFSLSVSAIAGSGTGMERDYDFTAAVFHNDLEDPAKIGRRAGERAVKRLNPRRVKTAQVPVVFDPRVANGLIRYFASAINGATIARGTSFLKNKMQQPVFAGNINIIDDPKRLRALRSRPFDAEGVATQRRNFIENGVLQSWILDCRSARQLGLKTTGHGGRGVGSLPSPSLTNFYLEAGTESPEALIADIKSGLYVTETMGMGVNLVSGDFSQGASGFWIENGQIAYPVSELTIAGHLDDMFRHMIPANDLQFKYGVDTPTLRIEKMTIAGQ